jgi:hypothetical protein
MTIRTTETGFDHCAREAQKRGYLLRDGRQGTLDGSGFTLRPESGGTLRDLKRFSTLAEVARALETLPVLSADSGSAHRNLCSEIPLPTPGLRRGVTLK